MSSLQEVINNLMISAIQFKSETDADIVPHVHQRCVQEIVVQPTSDVESCKQILIRVLADVITTLSKLKVCTAATASSVECACLG